MGRTFFFILGLAWLVAPPVAAVEKPCSGLLASYRGLRSVAAVLLDQNDPGLEGLRIDPKNSEVCGPVSLVNFTVLVARLKGATPLEKKKLLEKLLIHFDDLNVDARKGLYFEQMLTFLQKESYRPAEVRTVLPEGASLDGFGSAFSLRDQDLRPTTRAIEGESIAIEADALMPPSAHAVFASLVQIQLYQKDENPLDHASRYTHFMLLIGKAGDTFFFVDPQNPRKMRAARIEGHEKVGATGRALKIEFLDREFGADKKVLISAFFRLKITP